MDQPGENSKCTVHKMQLSGPGCNVANGVREVDFLS
jgi:hypothetical protein